MILLLSGEGKTDIGECDNLSGFCESEHFVAGPMAIFIDQLVEDIVGYSCLDFGSIRFISEHELSTLGKNCLVQKKRPSLPGKKKSKETGCFERNARALALKAKLLISELDDEVVAVLFRDADGTVSTGRGLYEKKRESMIRGFKLEEYDKGVPMIPKPKSEAWLLCAVKENPYQHCAQLENRSGNDNSPNPLKSQLDTALGQRLGALELAEQARERVFDVHRIDMPSMNWFKARLREVIL